jgi:hypothetical protein
MSKFKKGLNYIRIILRNVTLGLTVIIVSNFVVILTNQINKIYKWDKVFGIEIFIVVSFLLGLGLLDIIKTFTGKKEIKIKEKGFER